MKNKDKTKDRPKRDRKAKRNKVLEAMVPRIPRPMGLTGLCKEYQNTKESSTLYQIQKISVQDYVNHNFSFAGKQRTIDELAKFLHWTNKKIVQHISSPIKNWLEGYKVEDQYRVLSGFLVQMALSDRAQFQAQIDVLRREQGDTYVPFLTEQVNKALGLINENTKTLNIVAQGFKPNGPSIKVQQNTLVTGTQNPTTDQGRYLGINEAVRLLEAKRPENLLESESLQESIILSSVPLENVPEVIATKQQGLGSDGHEKPVLKKTKKDHTDRLNKGPIISSPIIIP